MATGPGRGWLGVPVLLPAAMLIAAAAFAGNGSGASADPGGTAWATVATDVPVYGPLGVTTTSLPAGARGVAYPAVALTATGGATPYTWSIVSGALPRGMQLQSDGVLSGRPETAANPILTVRVQDAESPPQHATAVLTLLVTVPGVHVTASGTGTTAAGATGVRVGGPGSTTPETVAVATGGTGTVNVAEYTGNPAPNYPAFQNAGTYFDIALSPGATFTRLTIVRCGLGASPQTMYWWSEPRHGWVRVTDQSFNTSTGCLTVVVTATTTPSLADLQGTYLAIGAPVPYTPPSSAPGLPVPAAPVAQPVIGSAGGLLGTADGAFQAGIPAAALPTGATLQVTEAPATAEAPPLPALPQGFVPVGPRFVLTGATLSQPVPAELHYDPTALQGLSAAHLSAYALQPGGTWTPVPTAADGADDLAETPVAGAETLVLLADLQTFADVPQTHWAADPIAQLTAAGALSGYPDGTFRPDAPVTRAEFVKMLDLALGLAPAPTGPSAFTDVPAGAWSQPWIAAAVAAGIAQGTSPTTFAPDATLTREQMAVLLARALHLNQAPAPHFTDTAAIDPWAVSAIGAASAAGYIHGFPDGSVQPTATTTRAQAAEVLSLVLLHRAGALR